MSKKLFPVALALMLALCLVGCERSHRIVGPVTPYSAGPLGDALGTANLFYGLGWSPVEFTSEGIYCYGQLIPWSEVRFGESAPFVAPPAGSARGDVSAATAGPKKDHPWGGDAYATIEGAGQPLYCSAVGRFVVLATAVGPGGKYWYVKLVGGSGDGLYMLVDPVLIGYYRCGTFDPFSMVSICKGGAL